MAGGISVCHSEAFFGARIVKILLAAFRPYDGERINASEVVVRSFMRRRFGQVHGVVLRYAILPTQTRALSKTLIGLLHRYKPDYVLLTGQAPGRDRVCIEQWASNNFQGQPVCAGAPAVLRASLPRPGRMVHALKLAGIPAGLSDDAGDYFCNMALFLALRHARTARGKRRVGFVHLPILPSQACTTWPAIPTLPPGALRRALEIILRNLLRHA